MNFLKRTEKEALIPLDVFRTKPEEGDKMKKNNSKNMYLHNCVVDGSCAETASVFDGR